MNNIFVSTTNELQGYEIIKYLDVYTERVVVGAGFFSEFFAAFTDIFGGRSGKFEGRLKELYDAAIDKLKLTAKQNGANAIVGLKIDVDEISGKNTQMFMVTVYGTGVVLQQHSDQIKLADYSYSSDKIHSSVLRQKVLSNKAVDKIAQNTDSKFAFETTLNTLIDTQVFINLEFLLGIISNVDYTYTDSELPTRLIDYLELYDENEVTEQLYLAIKKNIQPTRWLKELIRCLLKPNYQMLSDFLQIIDIEEYLDIFEFTLLKYKDSYTESDIILITELKNKLANYKDIVDLKVIKGAFGSEQWQCSCNKKNGIEIEYCQSCDRSKNGIKRKQLKLINTLVENFEDIVNVLDVELKITK